jgi:hypothetical protein
MHNLAGLEAAGRSGLGWMLFAFLVTFLVTRGITRLIRAGKGPFRDATIGNLHIHHQVYGIFLMLVGGGLEFTYEPGGPLRNTFAMMFGAGAALTLDEFALWFHMDDVYWSQEGRKSVDAVLITACVGFLLLTGINPDGGFVVQTDDGEPVMKFLPTVLVTVVMVFALIAALKGKVALALIGIFFGPVAITAAVRTAKPDSPWARWRYPEGSAKRAKALRRFPPGRRGPMDRFKDLVGGAPTV